MTIALTRPDGVHILTRATLLQLADDELLRVFAAGLIPNALAQIEAPDRATRTLAHTLHHVEPQTVPLVLALLVLDAEVSGVIGETRRMLPLAGFLAYRADLSSEKFTFDMIRLPPLNPDGHYLLNGAADFSCAVRLDLHPRLKVAGHVRVAISSSTHSPQRLQDTEHRLDRQAPAAELIVVAVAAGSQELSTPLTQAQQSSLIETIGGVGSVDISSNMSF
jgi:CO/xanthine dehydrogenase FAD-binding subunit